METVLQIILVGLALVGVAAVYGEVRNIFFREVVGGRLYLLCIPEEGMTEGVCRQVIAKRGALQNVDIIVSGKFSEEDEKIGRFFESAERNLYFIRPSDLPCVADPDAKISCL